MLQGSLDDFALVEILGLLAENSKTGQLDIDGDRGHGVLMFSSGKLSDARASKCDVVASLEDVMFELLRYQEGSFVFSNKEIDATGDEKTISTVLNVAESRLTEWQSIALVVPSLQHLVSPVAELPEDEITIDRGEWAALSVIAAGCPVLIVCEELDLGEVEGCRRIKHLIERGLVQLSESAAPTPDLPPQHLRTSTASAEQTDDVEDQQNESTLATPSPLSNGDSLVASLRGGASEPFVPPSPTGDHRIEAGLKASVSAGASNGDQTAASEEGLLMRYLNADES